MLEKEDAAKILRKLFRRRPVVQLQELGEVLETDSRMSVFRRLKEVGYRSSFTHAGRYYTLATIPSFDDQGLWFHGEIGFSLAGTLKATLAERIPAAEAGCTHAELEILVRVRVYNTLLDLVREGRIGCERWAGQRVYVSTEARRAAEQLARRQELGRLTKEPPPLTHGLTIEVLVEALQMSRVRVDPPTIAARVAARGLAVTVEQVRQVCLRYGLMTQKKTSGRASRRSRR